MRLDKYKKILARRYCSVCGRVDEEALASAYELPLKFLVDKLNEYDKLCGIHGKRYGYEGINEQKIERRNLPKVAREEDATQQVFDIISDGFSEVKPVVKNDKKYRKYVRRQNKEINKKHAIRLKFFSRKSKIKEPTVLNLYQGVPSKHTANLCKRLYQNFLTEWKINPCERVANEYEIEKFREETKDDNKVKQFFKNPKAQKFIGKTGKALLTAVAVAAITAGLTSAYNILPGLTDRVVSEVKLAQQDPTRDVSEPIPNIVNPALEVIVDSPTKTGIPGPNANPYNVSIDAATEVAIDNFDDVLSQTMSIFSNREGNIVPNIVVVNYDEENQPESLEVYCDLNEIEGICLEYYIEDLIIYQDVFNSDRAVVADVINGFSFLVDDQNLADVPAFLTKLELNGSLCSFATNVTLEQSLKFNQETKTNETIDVYSFTVVRSDNGELSKQIVEIPVEQAQSLQGFDNANLNSLHDIYKASPNSFDVTHYNLENNFPTRIFLSAIESSKDSGQEQ